uniref:Claudin-15 isoform X2 n=1 Tax=Geotrypetes seraphini TaxID=260995 RepID=A0A6P8Q274_GEOSA|nr:claudin-15 isoform X2 [Geotrypetes seraphini]
MRICGRAVPLIQQGFTTAGIFHPCWHCQAFNGLKEEERNLLSKQVMAIFIFLNPAQLITLYHTTFALFLWYLQACRALMISALLLGFLGALCGMVGLQCTKVADGNPVFKAKFATTGGGIFIFAGVCAGIALSWYAFNITKEFFDPLFPGTKYEIGPALYLGWSGCLLDVVGGGLLCCSYREQTNKGKGYIYNYQPPKATTTTIGAPQAAISRYESDTSICKYGKNAYV